jgi:phage tail tape-measure protein
LLGAAVGSVAPGPGTIIGSATGIAIGTLVGSVLGSAVGDWLGGMTGEWAQKQIIDRGWRDDAIRWLSGESDAQATAVTGIQPTQPAWSIPPIAPAFAR